MNSDEQRWRSQPNRPGNQPRRGGSYYNNNNANGNAWGRGNQQQQQQQQQAFADQHVPVNGFNAAEVEEMLNRGYDAMVNAAKASGPEDSKPKIYKSNWAEAEKPKTTPWGQRQTPNPMSNGANFVTKLKQSLQQVPRDGGN